MSESVTDWSENHREQEIETSEWNTETRQRFSEARLGPAFTGKQYATSRAGHQQAGSVESAVRDGKFREWEQVSTARTGETTTTAAGQHC